MPRSWSRYPDAALIARAAHIDAELTRRRLAADALVKARAGALQAPTRSLTPRPGQSLDVLIADILEALERGETPRAKTRAFLQWLNRQSRARR